jgi:Ca2+-transporting ATPase
VETLGACAVICTDKTGTLTKNQMTVQRLLIGKTEYAASGTGYEPSGKILGKNGAALGKNVLKEVEIFFATGAMASNAKVNPPDEQHATWYCLGDPTEGALVTLARKAGVDPAELDEKHKELKEFQFDSARKRMSSVRKYGGKTYVFVKGAPESVLACSTELWDHGHVRPLHRTDRNFFDKYNETNAREALRNLAFAYAELPHGYKPSMKLEDVEHAGPAA